jgi:hypothetical protein
MPSVARTMLMAAILVTVAYIGMCLVYVVGPEAGGFASAGTHAQQSLTVAELQYVPATQPILQQLAPVGAASPAVPATVLQAVAARSTLAARRTPRNGGWP